MSAIHTNSPFRDCCLCSPSTQGASIAGHQGGQPRLLPRVLSEVCQSGAATWQAVIGSGLSDPWSEATYSPQDMRRSTPRRGVRSHAYQSPNGRDHARARCSCFTALSHIKEGVEGGAQKENPTRVSGSEVCQCLLALSQSGRSHRGRLQALVFRFLSFL